MTKQEFLDGKEFTFQGNNYRLDNNGISISRVYRTSEGKELFTDNEVNVDKVGIKTVSTYKFIFGKETKHRLRFEDMKLYNAE